jgi:hypothetical protein
MGKSKAMQDESTEGTLLADMLLIKEVTPVAEAAIPPGISRFFPVYPAPTRANFFFGRGSDLEIFQSLQGSDFIQTLLFIYNHLAKVWGL